MTARQANMTMIARYQEDPRRSGAKPSSRAGRDLWEGHFGASVQHAGEDQAGRAQSGHQVPALRRHSPVPQQGLLPGPLSAAVLADKSAGALTVVAGLIAAVKLARVKSREIQSKNPRVRVAIAGSITIARIVIETSKEGVTSKTPGIEIASNPRMSVVYESQPIRTPSPGELPLLDPSPNSSVPGRTILDPRFHLAAIVDSSDDPIISKDLNGTIISWNQAAARLFGYQANEMVGQSILRIIPTELHPEEEAILGTLRAGQRIEHYETVRVKKSGERIAVSVTISPVRDETGQVIGASKIAHDISDRKRNDETRFRLAAIVDSADDAIISKDLNGIVRSWNQGAHQIFGYTAEEMIGQSILRIIPDERQYEEDEILQKLRAGQRIDHYETVRRKKNNETVEVSVTISPIKDESGLVIGASKIARDISERKHVERLLLQSEKLAATGRMAAAIAHEINNPLESIINLVYLARRESAVEGKAYRFLATAEEELERVSHLARQTLGYYRDTGTPAVVHLHDLIENVLTVYNTRLLTTGISVDTRFNDLQKILVSKGELIQVFSNIIANAIDAMRNGGSLRVSTRNLLSSSGDGIQVIIQDNGTGIKQEHLARIFEPFFTTKGDLGSGIGLWVAKQLIERRGGDISVASSVEKDNSGTTFTIFLPFTSPASRIGD
jgi:PAS domain S-box-containing protein